MMSTEMVICAVWGVMEVFRENNITNTNGWGFSLRNKAKGMAS